MRKVYLSFLGLGTYDPITRTSRYNPTVYELNREQSPKTEFVQVAEIGMMGADYFDKIIIVCTGKSYQAHFSKLQDQLRDVHASHVTPLIIEEDMSAEGQWRWFETILSYMDYGDELTIDMTHGYRSIPIVFSTAIDFLQKARNITLKAAYYGAYEKDKSLTPVVNMKDFYIINEWADAVDRLVQDADARKLAELSEKTPEFQFGELNDPELIRIFDKLTNTIRNVDVNNVADQANEAIVMIKNKMRKVSGTGKILLELVLDKFSSLATEYPLSGRYDKPYFILQLKIIKLLLEHKLFMQAYTVMREFIGSIGMIGASRSDFRSEEGRNNRYNYAEVFVKMVRIGEERWNFKDQQRYCDILKPYYVRLRQAGVVRILKTFVYDLGQYRNGFDHAWTSKTGAFPDIEGKGWNFYESLKHVAALLEKEKII